MVHTNDEMTIISFFSTTSLARGCTDGFGLVHTLASFFFPFLSFSFLFFSSSYSLSSLLSLDSHHDFTACKRAKTCKQLGKHASYSLSLSLVKPSSLTFLRMEHGGGFDRAHGGVCTRAPPHHCYPHPRSASLSRLRSASPSRPHSASPSRPWSASLSRLRSASPAQPQPQPTSSSRPCRGKRVWARVVSEGAVGSRYFELRASLVQLPPAPALTL
jgi:hypothetical protein